MTNVLLIRHAVHDAVGKKILGRTPGIHLNDAGKLQSQELAQKLSVLPIEAIYSGPLERTRESAEPLARRLGLPLHVADEFDELQMGNWTNRAISELDLLPEWHKWNTERSQTTPPNGESMHQVQGRALAKIAALGNRFSCIAIFTHSDVIRAALTHFLGMHLDLLFRFEIDPGSVSVIQMHADHAIVRMINWVPINPALK
jgi:broad specificity phosphatase PhoE